MTPSARGSGAWIAVGAVPGGGAAREVPAADGTQAECMDAGPGQLNRHTHDADGAAAALLPASSGPAVAVGAGAIEAWAVVPACRAWVSG